MLSLLYPISYLLALTGLVLWFYFKENRSISRKMSSLFLISFFVYLFSLAFSNASLSYKLLILCRDLLVLGVISQLFSFVRKSPIIVLVIAIGLYGLIQFVGFNILYSTFPEVQPSTVQASDEFELLVETKNGGIPKSYDRLIKKYGLVIAPAFSTIDPSLSQLDEFLVIGVPDKSEALLQDIMQDLLRIGGTVSLEYNDVIALDFPEVESTASTFSPKNANDPMAGQQWGWDAIQGDRLLELLSASGVKPKKKAIIAIVDSGVDAQHEDLINQLVSNGSANDTDPSGHGTHCAGIAGAVSNNGIGVVSLVPNSGLVNVTSIKVMNAQGFGTQQTTIQGIIKAADLGVDVISLSLGSISNESRQRAYEEAVKYANAKGAICVAAAGNSNQNAKGHSPANAKGIISVSALGPDLQKAAFSNTVNDLSYGIAAPGVRILSTYPGQEYKELNGTSMATPMVAGLIGILKAFRPELTTKEVYDILYDTGKATPDSKSTGRMIQAASALEKVMD